MMKKYTLDEHTPVPCEDVLEWARWMESANRRVASDKLNNCHVSTVFLGLDHNWIQNGEPQLFETMVFKTGESADLYMNRYATWEQAEVGHAEAVRMVQDGEITCEEDTQT